MNARADEDRPTALALPPLSLYVHIPWCVRKCPYCDFNSHAAPEQLPQAGYVDALLHDLELDLPYVQGREITSIFFGGGTPSLFDPQEIARFLNGVRSLVKLATNVEITLEANPGTIEHGTFAGYREAGINRVSLGVQSFNARHLQRLGRIHDAEEVHRAVAELNDAGIENFNLDLMYALPEQTLEEALADLETAIALRPTHLSHYQLTLEPGTVFYHRPPPLPDADAAWDMQEHSQALLASVGYGQYEVSAYAQSGFRCEHNLNYWRFGDYLGLGAGAHGKLTRAAAGEIVRTFRTKQPRSYLASPAALRRERIEPVNADDLPFEFMLNALRLYEPIDPATFESRTGRSRSTVWPLIQQAAAKGLLEIDAAGRWTPTSLGRRFLNDLQAMFLDDPSTPIRASASS